MDFCNAGADAGYIFSGPVRDGFVEAVETAARLKHEIIIITDRSFGAYPGVSQRLTMDWLNEHGIEYDELVFSADKTAVPTDMFIDDKLSNYDSLVGAGVNAYLLNRPWNKVAGGDARNRIDTIDQYAEAIKQATVNGFVDLTIA